MPPAQFTTNEEDRQETEKLKDRLRNRILVGSGVASRKVAPVQVRCRVLLYYVHGGSLVLISFMI